MAGYDDPANERFVLRFTGRDAGASRAEQLRARLFNTPGVRVLDASGKMMLVMGLRAYIEQELTHFPGWQLSPETHSPLP